jgi:hypothetical protein
MDIFVGQLTVEKEKELKDVVDEKNAAFTVYLEDDANFSNLWMVKKTWAVPFVTNWRYTVRFGKQDSSNKGLDFEQMQMHLSARWTEEDFHILFHSRHVDVRE